MSDHPLRIFSGSAHPRLASEIAQILNTPLGKSTTTYLPDSEIFVTIDEVVRGQDIYFVQPCSVPVNDHLMETLLYLDAFRRASVHSITLVMPYYPYARQERMARGREAISARVVANLLETEGADRIIFMDIHNLAIQGFFNIPVDPLSAFPVITRYFDCPEYADAAIVSPDVGRATLAGKYATRLNLPLVVMHKRRTSFSEAHTTAVVGEIAGHRPIIIDDMMASGSVLKQIDALYERGALPDAIFAVTHPILLPKALKILDEDERIARLVVCDTIPVPPEKMHPKLEVLSIAPLLADVIAREHRGESIIDQLTLA